MAKRKDFKVRTYNLRESYRTLCEYSKRLWSVILDTKMVQESK